MRILEPFTSINASPEEQLLRIKAIKRPPLNLQ
jgi:hypothetical protein